MRIQRYIKRDSKYFTYNLTRVCDQFTWELHSVTTSHPECLPMPNPDTRQFKCGGKTIEIDDMDLIQDITINSYWLCYTPLLEDDL